MSYMHVWEPETKRPPRFQDERSMRLSWHALGEPNAIPSANGKERMTGTTSFNAMSGEMSVN